MNYYCTNVPSNGTSLPTIWFEGSAAHGIVDFLGLQHSLAVSPGRNSCSYDPANFGWSENLPSSLEDDFGYFSSLLKTLNRQDEEVIIAGWGDGAKYGLIHANENPGITKALIILDASPDGIEWLDEQRKHQWNQKQMLAYRANDLSGRISLCQIILTLAIPW